MLKILILAVFLIFSSCTCNRYYAITGYDYRKITSYENDAEFNISHSIAYKNICDGIAIGRIENTRIPLIATLAKISLENSSLKIVATEDERFNNKGFLLPETTMNFAKRHNTNLAINANFFTYKCSFLDSLYRPLGLYIYKGRILSENREDFANFTFTKEKKAQINTDLLEDIHFAIAGFNHVIKSGKVILQGRSSKKDARTLIGFDKDEKHLFILCIDGKLEGSLGASLIDAANIFRVLGAFEAIELDGGNSSTIIAKIDGKQEQLVPSSKKQFRKVAINLGFVLE